jgi:hypothetical protein
VLQEQVNVGTDLAFCAKCNNSFKISEVIDLEVVNANVLREPPAGAWFRKEIDRDVIGASTRSPTALFIVPFMIVWSGGSVGSIYGSQLANGELDPSLSLFGIPFLIGSIILVSTALMTVFGKVEVSVGNTSSVFTGIGRVGWSRPFDWSAIKTIREDGANAQYPGSHDGAIVLEGGSRLKFGSGLNEQRRYFVLNALKHLKAKTRRRY